MTNWRFKVRVKHLFTDKEDHESIQKSMNAIADVLGDEVCFDEFSLKQFRNIPEGDDVITPCDYANKLISRMYDFADSNLIWIE